MFNFKQLLKMQELLLKILNKQLQNSNLPKGHWNLVIYTFFKIIHFIINFMKNFKNLKKKIMNYKNNLL